MFTCLTCQVGFRDADLQREHYKTDWHRYNLKRKVAEYPPVTLENFQKLIQNAKEQNKPDLKTSFYCSCCYKSFGTQKSYDNHLNSNKHKNKMLTNIPKRNENGPCVESSNNVRCDIDTADSDEWSDVSDAEIETNNCIFCNHHSRNLVNNLKHMTQAHSFFIPDVEYCVDIEGLIAYLGEKIFLGCMCIWCNDRGKTFHTVESAQSHMIDKGHCKMLHEGEALLEYADFYDYSSSYPDGVEGDIEVEPAQVIDGTDYQLVLPSGTVIGHRSLFRYYKQNLKPTSAVVPRNANKLNRVLAEYKSLGWVTTQKEIVNKKARDLKFMQRVQARMQMNLAVKANKLQKHFRAQVNF